MGSCLKVKPSTPLLLRRIEQKPNVGQLIDNKSQSLEFASHMTVVTTPGNQPEMHDQEDDEERED